MLAAPLGHNAALRVSNDVRAAATRKERTVRTSTHSITIAARPEDVFGFVADPEKLPAWAIGFAKGIRRENGGWLVRTGSGQELPIRVDADTERRTVDYYMSLAPGVEVPATTRVVPNGYGAEYVFTMFQPPELPVPAAGAPCRGLGRGVRAAERAASRRARHRPAHLP